MGAAATALTLIIASSYDYGKHNIIVKSAIVPGGQEKTIDFLNVTVIASGVIDCGVTSTSSLNFKRALS